MIKIITLLILTATGLFAQSNNPVSLVVTGRVFWVVDTNWTKSGSWSTLLWWNGEGENPNQIHYNETGTTFSNLYFGFEVEGQPHAVLLHRLPFGPSLQRSYTLKTDKVYRQ